jgi:hypothetical protein
MDIFAAKPASHAFNATLKVLKTRKSRAGRRSRGRVRMDKNGHSWTFMDIVILAARIARAP